MYYRNDISLQVWLGALLVIPLFICMFPVMFLRWMGFDVSIIANLTLGLVILWYLWCFFSRRRIETFITYRYVRDKLQTPIAWDDARILTGMFSADKDGRWHSFEEILEYPHEQRREALLSTAKAIIESRRAKV